MFALRSSTKKCAKQLTGALFFKRQTTPASRSLSYTENLADVVSSRLPSIVWNADALHGLTREQMDFRQSVRAFAEKELPEEVVKKIDADGHWKDFRAFWRKMGQMGLLGVTAPTQYGGLGLQYFDHVIAMEELSRRAGGIALSYGAHSNLCVNQITLNGSEEQKGRFLPSLIDGSSVGSLAMSEAGSGSDVTSMRTKAERKGDYYLLNGSKFWITNGPEADVVFLYAKTSDRGITAFLVEKGMEGFSVGQVLDKLGMRGSPTSELLLENVKVPARNVVGKVDGGVYVLMSGLDMERLVLSGGPLGLMQSAVEIAFGYAHERQQFGKAIGSFQLLQGKMADMYTSLSMARAYLYNTARALDQYKASVSKGSSEGKPSTSPFTKDCAAVILTLAETATKVALDSIQILGGNGYTNDFPVGRIMRDAKLYEIGAGTSEIRRWLIGRELNKDFAK